MYIFTEENANWRLEFLLRPLKTSYSIQSNCRLCIPTNLYICKLKPSKCCVISQILRQKLFHAFQEKWYLWLRESLFIVTINIVIINSPKCLLFIGAFRLYNTLWINYLYLYKTMRINCVMNWWSWQKSIDNLHTARARAISHFALIYSVIEIYANR